MLTLPDKKKAFDDEKHFQENLEEFSKNFKKIAAKVFRKIVQFINLKDKQLTLYLVLYWLNH